MNGVTKKITINVTIKLAEGKITATSKFQVVPED